MCKEPQISMEIVLGVSSLNVHRVIDLHGKCALGQHSLNSGIHSGKTPSPDILEGLPLSITGLRFLELFFHIVYPICSFAIHVARHRFHPVNSDELVTKSQV